MIEHSTRDPPKFYEHEISLPNDRDLEFVPPFVGDQNFKDDVLAMFSPKKAFEQAFPKKTMPLERQTREPYPLDEVLKDSILYGMEGVEAEILHRFYDKFRGTKLYQDILEAFDYNSEDSANFLLSLLEARSEDGRKTLSTILAETLIDADNSRMSSMIAACSYGIGNKGADFDIEMLKRADEVAKILRTLSIKYRSAARIHANKEEVIYPEDDVEPRNIRTVSEAPTISELIKDDDLYYQRLATKELQTTQHYKTTHNAKKYAVLVDTSGSMEQFEVVEYAAATVISLVENAMAGMNEVQLVLFDGHPREPVKFSTPDEVRRYMLEVPFSGGSTDIDAALKKMDNLGCDECILVTDGEDGVTYVPKTPLFTVFVNPIRTNESLRGASHSFEWVKASKNMARWEEYARSEGI